MRMRGVAKNGYTGGKHNSKDSGKRATTTMCNQKPKEISVRAPRYIFLSPRRSTDGGRDVVSYAGGASCRTSAGVGAYGPGDTDISVSWSYGMPEPDTDVPNTSLCAQRQVIVRIRTSRRQGRTGAYECLLSA